MKKGENKPGGKYKSVSVLKVAANNIMFVTWIVTEFFFFTEIPNFTGPILNVTVPLGREAMLECNIDNLSAYKVSICI